MSIAVTSPYQQTNAKTQRQNSDSVVAAALLSFYTCSLILVLFLATTQEARHWFAFPVFGCGVLIGVDVVRAIRGSIHPFEPMAFVGIIGVHFFFLAPLLHVRWDFWALYLTPPDDWRYWLGRMATSNLVGLGSYVLVRTYVLRRTKGTRTTYWELNRSRFYVLSVIGLIVTGLLQVYVYLQFNGVRGYIDSFETQDEAFRGMGILFALSESFPIIAMMLFVVWASGRPNRQTWLLIGLALVTFFVARLLFGGLRGSRSNTILAVFWAVGLVHLWVRPVSRKLLLIGAVFALVFMYAYGFYKTLGTDAVDAFTSGVSVTELEDRSGRTLEALFLGDLARADIQALMYSRLSAGPEGTDYKYAYGGTYVGAVSQIIPTWIWPDRPPTKVWWSTELLYGQGAAIYRAQLSTRAHGIAGEAMLNFGLLAVPIAYAVFGMIVGLTQRWWDGLRKMDSRLLLAPLVSIFTFYFLVWDSDNIVFFTVKNGLLPVSLVLATSSFFRTASDARQVKS